MQNPSGVPTDTDRWFVQIKEQTVGPLPGAKILERLLKDELHVTHRVSRDRKSWSAICNTPYFEELIEYRIRVYSGESNNMGPMFPGGDTSQFEISQVFGLHGATDGISEQLDQARQLEELTANIQKLNHLRKEIQLNKKNIVYEEENTQTPSLHPDDQNVYVPAVKPKKKFDFKDLLKGSESGRRRMLWIGAVVIIGLVLTNGYSYFSEQKKMAEDRNNLRDALAAQASGDYAKAIASFREVHGINRPGQKLATSRELIKLAEAHIKGKESQIAQQLLEQAAEMEISTTERARIHTLKASMAAQGGDLKKAVTELEASLKNVEDFTTLHNLGTLLLKMQKPTEAESFLLKALALADKSPGSDISPTILGIFVAAATLERETPTKPRLEAVGRMLETNLITTKSLKDEQHVALAITRYLQQQPDAFRAAALDLIDSPKSVDAKLQKADLDYDLANWSLLYKYCTEIYNKPTSSDFAASFYAACLRRSHGAQSALPFAKYALALRPTDAAYIGLTADLLIELGKYDEARGLLIVDNRVVSASKLGIAALQRLQQYDRNARTPAAAAPAASASAAPSATTAPPAKP